MNKNGEVSKNSTDIMGKSAITDDNDDSLDSNPWRVEWAATAISFHPSTYNFNKSI